MTSTAPPGWFGRYGELRHFLRTMGADRDPDDPKQFLIEGGVYSFMGQTGNDADVAVSADASYFVDGQRRPLAANLRLTSYGMKVVVID